MTKQKNTKIMVHCHIFYGDLWNELKEKLKNITIDYDLFVTMVKNDEILEKDILESFPQAKIIIVENKGYDVAPFLFVLNLINLSDYEYIIKIHTKRNLDYDAYINYYDVSDAKWREYLLAFLGSKDSFNKCLNAFDSNEKLGMVSNYRLILKKESCDFVAKKLCKVYLKKMGFSDSKYGFVAGTMFMARASLFTEIKNLNMKTDDFKIPDEKRSSSLAHMFERLFGAIVITKGYEITDVFSENGRISNFFYQIKRIFFSIAKFFFQIKYTSHKRYRVKILKIPLPAFLFSMFKRD